MKKLLLAIVIAVLPCFSSWAVDLAVPEELVGSDTVGILHVHLKALKFEQVVSTLTEKLGEAPNADALAQFRTFLEKFKDAGGQGVSVIINADKQVDAANASDNIVFLVTKKEDADVKPLTELLSAPMSGMPNMAPGCPKEIGNALVWYSAKYKLPKANEDRAAAFSEAYSHLAKNSSVSFVFVPTEEVSAVLEKEMKDASADEKKSIKALMGATGICVFSDFGVAEEPALKALVLAADADGAVQLEKAAKGLLEEVKKSMPPPVQTVLNGLTSVQVGANVQMSINIGDIMKAAKAMAPKAEAPKP